MAFIPTSCRPVPAGPKRRFVGLAVLWLAAAIGVGAADHPKKRFDVPAEDAGQALKEFSVQSGLDVVFAPQTVSGTTTNAVRGDYLPQEAVRLLLAKTGLVAVQDTTTGAFMINKPDAPDSPGGEHRPPSNSPSP